MADSGLLGKLLGMLKGYLNSMSSPLGGYDIDDAKMSSKDGQYSVLYQFGTDHAVKDESGEDISTITGEKIQLNVLLATANLKQVIEPLLSGLNVLGSTIQDTTESKKKASDLLAVFLGSGREASEDGAMNSSDTAKGGLLGVDLTKMEGLPTDTYPYDGQQWSWGNIMGEFMKYSLECELAGGKYGAIENVTASQCANLIPEYLMKVNAISSPEEIKVDIVALVKPIAIRLQADLKQYYDAAYAKYENIKDVADTYESDRKAEADEKAKAEAEANKQERAVFDQNGAATGEYVDISTPEGQARLSELRSQGYNIWESKQIKITLRKIQGSTDLDILSLASNYNRSETLDDLDDIIVQDTFMESITEDPQTYTIDVDDDGYDVATCELCEADPCESLKYVFKQGITLYENLYILHWMAKGNDMMKLHTLSEELYGELIQEIDTIGELLVEKCGAIPQPGWVTDYLQVRPYEFQESLDILKKYIQDYIDCLDYAYPNQTSDVQSTLDEWLRYWNKQLNYFIKGQEV